MQVQDYLSKFSRVDLFNLEPGAINSLIQATYDLDGLVVVIGPSFKTMAQVRDDLTRKRRAHDNWWEVDENLENGPSRTWKNLMEVAKLNNR